MNIGVDTTVWTNPRGYGRQARALLQALVNQDRKNQYTFIFDSQVDSKTIPRHVTLQVANVKRATVSAATAKSARSLEDMWRISKLLSARVYDILLFPTVFSYVPVISSAKKILFIHDIIPEKFPELTLPTFSSRFFWKSKSWLGRSQADAIVTVSEYSREQISGHFHIPLEKIYVVGEAGDPVFRQIASPELNKTLLETGIEKNRRLVVYIGGFGPHKNLPLFLNVFAKLVDQPAYSNLSLVLVGENRKETFYTGIEKLKEQVDALGLAGHVIFTGYLPDEDLVILLNKATLTVLPSLMEGFGLPAIEAAACGCPVIATRESPLPEIFGPAALYFNPYDPRDLESALKTVLSSPEMQAEMTEGGLAVARSLSWENAAMQMVNVLESVARS